MPDFVAATIGNFDGCHLGHVALVRQARAVADAGSGAAGQVVAFSFDPHPAHVLRPGAEPARLSCFERRAAWLREAGADEVVRLNPSDGTLALAPREFVKRLLERLPIRAIVEGPDFHFGHRRAGNVRVLAELGAELGFSVHVVAPVEVALTDGAVVTASSTLARWLISHGRVADAARVLGRPYELRGEVVPGDQRGRTIGFPTANLKVVGGELLPADGVYAAEAVLPNGRIRAAMLNIGVRPTVGGLDRRIEPHILAATGEVPPDYGWSLTLRLHAWVRDQVRFPGLPALVDQLHRDRERVRRMLPDAVGA